MVQIDPKKLNMTFLRICLDRSGFHKLSTNQISIKISHVKKMVDINCLFPKFDFEIELSGNQTRD